MKPKLIHNCIHRFRTSVDIVDKISTGKNIVSKKHDFIKKNEVISTDC